MVLDKIGFTQWGSFETSSEFHLIPNSYQVKSDDNMISLWVVEIYKSFYNRENIEL